MTKLGIRTAAAAVLLGLPGLAGLVALAPAAGAATPVSGLPWVSGTCSGGEGVVTMTMRGIDADTTRVRVRAHDVANGVWSGGLNTDGDGGAGTDIRVRAADHAFAKTFVIEKPPLPGGTLVLFRDRDTYCALTAAHRARRTYAGGGDLTLMLRQDGPGTFTTRGLLSGCRNGSEWETDLRLRFPSGAAGGGDGGLVCRHHRVHVPKSTMHVSGTGSQVLRGARLLLRGPSGDVRRIAYRVPAAD
jgi:hypothetical protein